MLSKISIKPVSTAKSTTFSFAKNSKLQTPFGSKRFISEKEHWDAWGVKYEKATRDNVLLKVEEAQEYRSSGSGNYNLKFSSTKVITTPILFHLLLLEPFLKLLYTFLLQESWLILRIPLFLPKMKEITQTEEEVQSIELLPHPHLLSYSPLPLQLLEALLVTILLEIISPLLLPNSEVGT
jgi:hypothetical protein